jgi:hypothetical protein
MSQSVTLDPATDEYTVFIHHATLDYYERNAFTTTDEARQAVYYILKGIKHINENAPHGLPISFYSVEKVRIS